MATNNKGTRGAKEILDAVVTRLKAMKIGAEPAFAEVAIFSVLDFKLALEKLILSKDRIAVAVYEGSNFKNQILGTELVCTQSQRVSVFVSDRVIGPDITKAMMGSKEHPGAQVLAELVQWELPGVLLQHPNGILIRPMDDEPTLITSDEMKNQPGRAVVWTHFEAVGGQMQKDLGKGAFKIPDEL